MEKKQRFCTSIGGQALIEGIMMLGPDKQAIVVRSPDGIIEKVEDRKLVKDNYPILGIPLIRGIANFLASLFIGVKALMYSAEFFPEDEDLQPSKFDKWVDKHLGGNVLITISVIISLFFSVGMFIILPTLIAGLFSKIIEIAILRNLIEGILRISIFLLYLFLVSRMKDIQRVFAYHGAEHKTIFCYEAGLDLTVENVKKQSRLHPRCGTSFLFVVVIISILVFSVVKWSNPFLRVVIRLALLPVVVAISYEINRIVGRHDNWLTRAVSAPGKWLQKLSTREPDDSMIEVAIAAIKLVIPEVQGKDEW